LGCTIFVKLWQFDPDDRSHVRVDTARNAYVAAPDRPGVALISLYQDPRENVRLERWAPDTEIVMPVTAGMELLVLNGGFSEGGERFEAQSWLRLPAGATFRARAHASGCRVWVKTGHLATAQTAPRGAPQ
jgi:hypothetical protein